MSIRLRFTLLYNAILALTLIFFSVSLYAIQAQTTLTALRQDLERGSHGIGAVLLQMKTTPPSPAPEQFPLPFNNFSGEKAFRELPERQIVRVLDASGNLIASPFGLTQEALPLSAEGLKAAQNQSDWWESNIVNDERLLIYTRPLIADGKTLYILQIARPLTELQRSMKFLGTTLLIASLVTLLAAFGIGWALSGITLRPIQRLTQSAQTIGQERDFTRRVTYNGPQDEVGQLATTLNTMLERLQDAYQKVEHALEMQRNFVADVSHELRTPLTTLRGNLGLLRREPSIPAEEQSDILTDMTDESDRMIRLVNDLLLLARADSGRNLTHETLALLPVLEESCRQARQLDPKREIHINAEAFSVLGDRDALKQVLLIGLDNALKHSSGAITVSARAENQRAAIRIQDSGAGIAPKNLARVFDRFYRGAENATLPGFGLGLPIAKALMENMGGAIMLESEAGRGSTLTLFLPVAG